VSEAAATGLICYHKQKTSARTRFLRIGASVLVAGPLPASAAVSAGSGSVQADCAMPLRAAERRLGLADGALRAETEYCAEVQTPAGTVAILLAEFTSIDPPFAAAEAAGGRFIAITEARDLPPVELELMRRAYEVIIG